MENTKTTKHEAHCVLLPFPLQGHINPMIQFAKSLANQGVRITLATTQYMSKYMQHLPSSITVETISDGFDEGGTDVANDIAAYVDRFEQVGPDSLSQLLDKLQTSGYPADCVIYGSVIPWALVVAKKFGLWGASFFTQPNYVNIIYYMIYEKQLKTPLLDKEILVPGLPAMEISDMPSFLRYPGTHSGVFERLVDQFRHVEKADFVFVNSIYDLEEEATDWIAKFLPVKTIGPTIPFMYSDKRLSDDKHYGFNIFKPSNACIDWLDKRPTKSVIYVSFGSMANLGNEQMEELALGLKMTNKPFLWVVRSSEESKLPINFAKETSEKGLIVSWCPQLEVLANDAIGCFVTHCGWNSTLEALSLGVPMVTVPWWSDQTTNAKFVTDVWKVGSRACSDEKNIIRHQEIVRCVENVMEEEAGAEIRNNAWKWKELTREAVAKGGSSYTNIHEFVSTIVGDMPPK